MAVSSRATPRPRRRLGPLLPWVVGSVGLGVAASESPTLAMGLGAAGAVSLLPWTVLFTVVAVSTSLQRWAYTVHGVTFRPDELVAAVFALRAFAIERRRRLEAPEWLVIAFLFVQAATSQLHAVDVHESFLAVGLLGFGVMAYLATYATARDRRRLLIGVRLFLSTLVAGAAIGIGALVSYYAVGTVWGVTRLDTLGGFPAAMGVAFEHDVFGSTCAAGVVIFLVLWREPNPLFAPRTCAISFWICAAATALSLARGAWVALVVGLVVMAGATRLGGRTVARSAMPLLVAGVAIVVVGLAAVLYFGAAPQASQVGTSTASAIGRQASNVLNFGASTGAHRLNNWKAAMREVRASPLLGLGTNSFGQRHFETTIDGPIPAFLGNWAIRTLYDSGLVGLGLLVAFLWLVAWPGREVRSAAGDLAPVARALVFGLVVLGVAYLATDALLLVWPWALLGLARAARALSAEQESLAVQGLSAA